LCPYGQYYPYYYGTAYPYYSNGGYAGSDYLYNYGNDGQYAANSPVDPNAIAQPTTPNQMQQPADAEQAGMEALQYYNDARAAFEQGDYRDALRLVGHSGLDSPQNPKVHELASLGLFASGDYRSAATEAHAALAFGTPSNWSDLYGYYNDVDKYTSQLRKLENTVTTTPNSAPAQFLLGYHYLMTGATPEAKQHFALAAKLTPNDKLVQHIVKQLDSGAAVTPPELPKPPAQGNEQQPQLPAVPTPPAGQQL
jgi:tetratricopeptide (TPR) repeat protein